MILHLHILFDHLYLNLSYFTQMSYFVFCLIWIFSHLIFCVLSPPFLTCSCINVLLIIFSTSSIHFLWSSSLISPPSSFKLFLLPLVVFCLLPCYYFPFFTYYLFIWEGQSTVMNISKDKYFLFPPLCSLIELHLNVRGNHFKIYWWWANLIKQLVLHCKHRWNAHHYKWVKSGCTHIIS